MLSLRNNAVGLRARLRFAIGRINFFVDDGVPFTVAALTQREGSLRPKIPEGNFADFPRQAHGVDALAKEGRNVFRRIGRAVI